MAVITFEIEQEYLDAKALIEANRPEEKVAFVGKAQIKPDATRPYTAYYDTELALEADNHILQLLQIDFQ